jgi:drug/metabolite transporter (DMT)-like permease
MLPILLALATALSYGGADFLIGLASRRSPIMRVMLLSQGTATLLTIGIGICLGGRPSQPDLVWGALAGVALLAGLALLAYAFRDGRISEVSPIIGVTSVMVPVIFSLCQGARFSAPVYLGIGLAIVAIATINRTITHQDISRRSHVPLIAAMGAGLGFGLFSTILSVAAHETNFWIITVSNVVRFALLLAWLALALRKSGPAIIASGRQGITMAIVAGLFTGGATLLYLAALQNKGNLAIVNTISCQATIVNVICACVVLKERIYPLQAVGILASVASIALIASCA